MSLLKLDDAKKHLNITANADDAELQRVIDAAEARLAVELGGPLAATSRTERLTGGAAVLILKVAPAISLTTVTDAFGTELDTDDLYLDTATGLVTYSDGRGFGAPWYDVAYSAGHATAPANILQAVKELVRHLWKTQRGQLRVDAEAGADLGFSLPRRVLELIEKSSTRAIA